MESLNSAGSQHKIVLNGREHMAVEGVEDVISFDEKQVILDTTKGRLVVKGTELHVNKLSLEKGIVDFEGSVDSIDYVGSQRRSGETLFSRIFG